jgi:hypothetical protein
MPRTHRTRTGLLAALVAAVGLSACSDNGTARSTTALTASQAQDVADVVTTDADAMIDASTVTSTGVPLAPGLGSGNPPCSPAITPVPPSNTDGDLVPDSVRFDFAGCSFSRGPFDFVVSGIIDVTDPAPAPDNFGIRFFFTGFTSSRTLQGTSRTVTVEFNGARQITGTSSSLSHLITNFQTDVTLPGGGTVQHVKDWNGSFTADVAGSIAPGQPLPSGTLNLAGTSHWTRGADEDFSIVVTSSGLHYDAACTIAPKFDAGTITAVVTRGELVTNVIIQHTACGQYTVTRSHG